MQITVRGWGRDMGETTIIEQDLTELKLNKDERRTVYPNRPPELFRLRWSNVALHWFQKLRLTGNYRMELELSEADVLRLLKASYGTVLGADLIERYGFELSPELEKPRCGKSSSLISRLAIWRP